MIRWTSLLLGTAWLLVSHAPVHAQDAARGARAGDQVITLEMVPEGLPFSPAIRVGGLIFLSGQIGILPGTTDIAEGGTAAETRQAMLNIEAVLAAAGASLYDVVKCTVFLEDMADYDAMNEIYASFWDGPPPARSTIGVDGLALGAALEIECLASDPAGR